MTEAFHTFRIGGFATFRWPDLHPSLFLWAQYPGAWGLWSWGFPVPPCIAAPSLSPGLGVRQLGLVVAARRVAMDASLLLNKYAVPSTNYQAHLLLISFEKLLDVLSRFFQTLPNWYLYTGHLKKCNKKMGSPCLFLCSMLFILSVFYRIMWEAFKSRSTEKIVVM